MVWKFNSAAAEVKHAERLNRGDVFSDAPVLTDVLLEGDIAPAKPRASAEPLAPVKVEPVFRLQKMAGSASARTEPSFAPAPAVVGVCDAAALARGATLLPEPPASVDIDVALLLPGAMTPKVPPLRHAIGDVSHVPSLSVHTQPLACVEVDVASFPATDLSWDVPAFAGTPDELPDLRPAAPSPIAHPGLQFRSLNTFGHALRLPAEDDRQALWMEQRRDRGFDDTELWGLDDAFARFILPRLKALRQQKLESPSKRMELTQWYSFLDKMIRAFELLLPEGGGAWSRGTLNDRERAQVQEGLDLFRQYYFSLSW